VISLLGMLVSSWIWFHRQLSAVICCAILVDVLSENLPPGLKDTHPKIR
jgi:hypothetical protein